MMRKTKTVEIVFDLDGPLLDYATAVAHCRHFEEFGVVDITNSDEATLQFRSGKHDFKIPRVSALDYSQKRRAKIFVRRVLGDRFCLDVPDAFYFAPDDVYHDFKELQK